MKLVGLDLPPVVREALATCRTHFLAAAGFSLFINLLYLAPTIYMLQVYDRVVPTGGKTTLLFVTIALALALATLSLLDMVRSRLLVRVGERLDAAIAPRILRQMMSADSATAGQAMRDFDTVRTALSSPTIAAMFDAPWIPVFLGAAFLLDVWIGVLAILCAAILTALAWWNQRSTARHLDLAGGAMAAAHASQQAAALHGATIKALGMSSVLVDRQLAHRDAALAHTVAAQFAGGRISAGSRFARLFLQSIALGLGALLAIAGQISAGAIIASSVLLSRALQPIESIIGGWSSLGSARAAARRLSNALAGTEPDRHYTTLPTPSGAVELSNIGVRTAEGTVILAGVNLAFPAGSIVGVVGPSGSGKTTLGKVLVGALRPSLGTVRLDGANIADWDPDDLGRQLGYMPQEPSLLEGSVRDNIARFAPDITPADRQRTDQAVIAAARAAGVHDLILRLPDGYDTRLGLTGAGLSAGQAQRVALARALFRDPSLLVLDEPNAFLDQAGESALIEAMRAARARGAAVVVIAHRHGILDCADRLVVLEGGQLKLAGPAADVVARLAGKTPSERVA